MSVRTPTLDVGAMRAPSLPNHRDAWLWATAIALFGVGDLVTTSAGLSMGLVELNPALADHGLLAMLAVKLGAFGVAALGYRVIPTATWVPPAVFSVFGAIVVPWNLLVLSGVIA